MRPSQFGIRRLTPAECHAVADALGDTPETVIPVHLLRCGLCQAYGAQQRSDCEAVVIHRRESIAFGDDLECISGILTSLDDWTCVNVDSSNAVPIGAQLEISLGCCVRYYGDIYLTLTKPPVIYRNDAVRLLSLEDVPLLDAAPPELRGRAFGNVRTMLRDGVVAGAIGSTGLVAIAYTTALTDRHADVGVHTLAPYRNHGFATAAASLVAEGVWTTGRTPVWSAGEDNFASLRVAQKVGFREVSRRTFVITEGR